MRKIAYFLAFGAVAALASLSSCNKASDPKPAPVVDAYIGTSGTVSSSVTPGTSVTVTLTVTAEAGIKEITGKDAVGSSSTDIANFPKTSGFTSSTEHSAAIIYSSNTSGKHVLTFTVTDKDGSTTTKEVTIYVGAAMGEIPNQSFYNIASANSSAYLLQSASSVAVSSSNTSADMINNTVNVSSTYPYVSGWDRGSASTTTFVSANSFDYTNANDASAEAAYAAGTATTSVASVSVGDIYIAKKGSDYYVIKITAVVNDNLTGVGNNNDYITFSLKY